MVKQTEAIRLAEASDWRGLQRLIEKQPEYARQSDDYGMLPIHWASTENNVPISLLNKLLEAYPQGASIKNNASLLPIHIAIRARVKAKWLAKLLEVFPEGIHVRTPNGQSVMEIAVQAGLSSDAMQVLDNALNCKEISPENDNDNDNADEYSGIDSEADILETFDGKMSLLISGNSRTSSASAASGGGVSGHLVIGQGIHDGGSGSGPGSVHPMCQGQLVSPSSTSTSSQGFNSTGSTTGDTPTGATPTPETPQSRAKTKRSDSVGSWTHMLRKSMHSSKPSGPPPAAYLNQRKHSLDQQSLLRNGGIFPRRMHPMRHQSLPQIPSFVQVLNSSQNRDIDTMSDGHPGHSSHGVGVAHSVLDGSTSSRISEHHSEDEIHFFESPPEWKRDDECSICRASFGMFKHRHHCRNCGKSICSQHSADKKIIMTSKGFTTPQRVCVTCYAMITHNRARTNQQESEQQALFLNERNYQLMASSANVNVALMNGTTSMRLPTPSSHGHQGGPRSSMVSMASRRSSLPPTHSLLFANDGTAQAHAQTASVAANHATGNARTTGTHEHHHHDGDHDRERENDRAWQQELERDQQREREKAAISSETLLLQSQLMEMRLAMGALQKQVEQLTQMNMTMQQQMFEQEETKAETTLLITQLMTRVSMLELHRETQVQAKESF